MQFKEQQYSSVLALSAPTTTSAGPGGCRLTRQPAEGARRRLLITSLKLRPALYRSAAVIALTTSVYPLKNRFKQTTVLLSSTNPPMTNNSCFSPLLVKVEFALVHIFAEYGISTNTLPKHSNVNAWYLGLGLDEIISLYRCAVRVGYNRKILGCPCGRHTFRFKSASNRSGPQLQLNNQLTL